MRENTERPVTVEVGSSTFVGNDPAALWEGLRKVITGEYDVGRCPELWDGHAADRIVGALVESDAARVGAVR